MDEKELKVIWYKMSSATFDKFIAENIGYKEDATLKTSLIPECFDSGDGHPWCDYCKFQPWC